MPLRQGAVANQIRRRSVELTQAKQVGDRRSIQSHTISELLMGQSKVITQSTKSNSPLDWIEILTLDVLNQREFGRHLVVRDTDDCWNLVESNQLCRSPTAFTGNELKPPSGRSDHDRLHQSCSPYGLRESCNRPLIEVRAGLSPVRNDLLKRDLTDLSSRIISRLSFTDYDRGLGYSTLIGCYLNLHRRANEGTQPSSKLPNRAL